MARTEKFLFFYFNKRKNFFFHNFFNYIKTVNIYNRRAANGQGYVNNQITDWSFKVDAIMHNVSQDAVYDQVVKDITLKTLDGYNGLKLNK